MFQLFVPWAILHENADGSLVSFFFIILVLDDALVHEREQILSGGGKI